MLLGQNVNSYNDESEQMLNASPLPLSRGFGSMDKTKLTGLRFTHLMDRASQINPEMRIRFTSPHPKDFPDDVCRRICPVLLLLILINF